jgi:integrase
MRGNLTRRGANSWRLKLAAGRDPATGKRLTRFSTVRGTKRQAEAELARQVAAQDAGTLVEPSKTTLADYLRSWIETAATLRLSPKTAERYRQLIKHQIVPYLGALPVQKVKPVHVATWHATLLKAGGHGGGALTARTVGHAHRVLHKALADAARYELLVRNPAALVSPPKVAGEEMEILSADQVKAVLAAMRSTVIFPQVVVLLSTGMRRGELVGLQWGDLDLEAGKLRIERAVEKTKARGLRLKSPKTKHGRRLITLPTGAVEILRQHRKAQIEIRLALGIGGLPADAFVFGTVEGAPRDPDRITQDWKRFTAARGLPKVTLHALRHAHASALILFDRSDEAAAKAIDAVLGI